MNDAAPHRTDVWTIGETAIVPAILAGGQSSRMGADKASLLVNGETVLARTVRIARAATGQTPLVIGRDKPTDWHNNPAHFLPDDAPGTGPVAGLLTALKNANGCPVLLLACDMPALTEYAMIWIIADDWRRLGSIARNGDQLEPLFSLYMPACIPFIAANLAAGRRSLHALIDAGGDDFGIHDAPPHVAAALTNVNTPQEWDAFVANTAL